MNDSAIDRLSERQRACLRAYAGGFSIKEIARQQDLTVDGVQYHLREARRLLEVGSSREAARMLTAREPGDYTQSVAEQKQSLPGEDHAASVVAVGPGSLPFWRQLLWPYPTPGNEINDLNARQRLTIMMARVVLILTALGIALLGVAAANWVFLSLPH